MNRRLNNLVKSNRDPIQERVVEHYGNDSKMTKERDRSPVEIAVSGVGCSIDELDKMLTILYGRLDSVLSPSTPQACDKAQCSGPADNCTLCEEFASYERRIRGMIDVINYILQRLQL